MTSFYTGSPSHQLWYLTHSLTPSLTHPVYEEECVGGNARELGDDQGQSQTELKVAVQPVNAVHSTLWGVMVVGGGGLQRGPRTVAEQQLTSGLHETRILGVYKTFETRLKRETQTKRTCL